MHFVFRACGIFVAIDLTDLLEATVLHLYTFGQIFTDQIFVFTLKSQPLIVFLASPLCSCSQEMRQQAIINWTANE